MYAKNQNRGDWSGPAGAMPLRSREEVDELLNSPNPAATFTFSHDVESFRGMRVHGKTGAKPVLTRRRFDEIAEALRAKGNQVEVVRLEELVEDANAPEATLLIIHPGGPLGMPAAELLGETDKMKPSIDGHFWNDRRKIVMNKQLRFNGVLTDEAIPADLPNGQGTVMNFADYPVASSVRKRIGEIFGEGFEDLYGEVNYYFDASKCGIGFHGDAERNMVIGFRVGEPISLAFQWFQRSRPVGERFKRVLAPGTLYAFDEKAVGSDWKSSSILTLRHAAGAEKCMPSNESLLKKKRGREDAIEETDVKEVDKTV